MILKNSDHFLIFAKPTAVHSEPQANSSGPDAVSLLKAELGNAAVGRWKLAPEEGLLHRLDRGTSGCLIFAKTPEARAAALEAWKTPAVRKTYRALSRAPRDWKWEGPFEITDPLVRAKKTSKRVFLAAKLPEYQHKGEPLPAHSSVLAQARVAGGLIESTVEIHTGVMHQIRVHLMSRGLPIVGDSVYGNLVEDEPPMRELSLEARLYLHAWKLALDLPALGERGEIEAPMPPGWPAPLS